MSASSGSVATSGSGTGLTRSGPLGGGYDPTSLPSVRRAALGPPPAIGGGPGGAPPGEAERPAQRRHGRAAHPAADGAPAPVRRRERPVEVGRDLDDPRAQVASSVDDLDVDVG